MVPSGRLAGCRAPAIPETLPARRGHALAFKLWWTMGHSDVPTGTSSTVVRAKPGAIAVAVTSAWMRFVRTATRVRIGVSTRRPHCQLGNPTAGRGTGADLVASLASSDRSCPCDVGSYRTLIARTLLLPGVLLLRADLIARRVCPTAEGLLR